MGEAETVRRQRRERQFTELYERHYATVLAYACRRVDPAAARDVAAETFLVAWRHLDQAAERGLPWLYRTAGHAVSNWQRTQRRADRTRACIAAQPEAAGPADPAVLAVEQQVLRHALLALPPADRELLLLTAWEGLELRGAAAAIGASVGTTAVRLHRARRRLRALLAEEPDPARRPLVRTSARPEVIR